MKKLFDKKVITCLVILCVTGIFFYVRNKNNLSEIDTNNTDLLYHGWDVGDVINHTYIYSNGKVVESSNLKENRIIKRLSKKQINRLRELIDKCEIKI